MNNDAAGTDRGTTVMKSVSEGELGVEEEVKHAGTRGAATRLKRTFTLPRNPFQSASSRMSRRRPKQQQQQQQQQQQIHSDSNAPSSKENARNNARHAEGAQQQRQNAMGRLHGGQGGPPQNAREIQPECQERPCGKKVFRRPSWRKFINKMVRHMSNVGAHGHKTASHHHHHHHHHHHERGRHQAPGAAVLTSRPHTARPGAGRDRSA
jgi:hypothetical protein